MKLCTEVGQGDPVAFFWDLASTQRILCDLAGRHKI